MQAMYYQMKLMLYHPAIVRLVYGYSTKDGCQRVSLSFSAIATATFCPSMAALMIPPA